MKMKKLVSSIVVGAISISMAGCGLKIDSMESPKENSEVASETIEAADENINVSEENADQTDEFTIPEEETTVLFETVSEAYKAEDGTEILTATLIYPVVSIQGKGEIAQKINDNIESEIERFHFSVQETLEMVQSDYEYYKTEEGYDFYAYSLESRFELERNDMGVISFTLLDWSYTGGAHGNYGTTGLNYDAATGELLTLASLSSDPDQFKTLTGDQFVKLSETTSYQQRLFETYDRQTLMDNLFQEFNWYLSASGIVFIADPYLLGPYAAGSIEFLIPYEDCKVLKPEYQYQGNYERMIPQGDPIEKDLNGDGTPEEIIFKVEYSEEDYTAIVTFQINRADITHDAVLAFPNEEFYLVDLDQNDPYIEVALQDYGPSDDPMTYFFRYLEDGTTVLLGGISDLWSSSTTQLVEDGLLKGSTRLSVLQTWYAPAHWKLEGNKLKKVEETIYYPYPEALVENGLLKNITVYKDADQTSDSTILTPQDGPVKFVATDDKNWIQVQTKEENSYYLMIEEYSKVESDGVLLEATEVFDSLIIAD